MFGCCCCERDCSAFVLRRGPCGVLGGVAFPQPSAKTSRSRKKKKKKKKKKKRSETQNEEKD